MRFAWAALAAISWLLGCSGNTSGASKADGGSGALYGVCSVGGGSSVASLGMSVPGVFGFTLPLPAGQPQDVTFAVENSGGADATRLGDLTPQSSALSYKGGSYPGTGGTCGTTLAAGGSCTLVTTVTAPASGRHTSLLILQYYDGVVFKTDTHEVEVASTSGAFTSTPHAPLPAMPSHGGAGPLTSVSMVTVSFSDTPVDSDIAKFGDWLVTSKYWATVGADYGIGPGTHQHVRLSDATPGEVYAQDFASYVDQKVSSGALPTPGQAVYVFFLSGAATVTDVPGAGGWHDKSPGGRDYAVILPACSSDPATILAQYAYVTAHEMIEAATDPAPLSGFNFGFGEGEVGDVCDGAATEGDYTLPTIWSNSAAAKGGDPCLPATGLPYVDVEPSPSSVSLSAKAGAQTTVALKGWSTQRVGDWIVELQVVGQGVTAKLDPSATDLLNDGQSVNLVIASDGSGSAGGKALVQITSYAPDGAFSAPVQGIRFVPVTLAP